MLLCAIDYYGLISISKLLLIFKTELNKVAKTVGEGGARHKAECGI